MGIATIREQYRVPAKVGMRVTVDGKFGVITSASRTAMHLNVRFDGENVAVPVHPTWRVIYDPDVEAPPAMTWRHSRKGLITGEVVSVSKDGEWTRVRLRGDHRLRYGSESNRDRIDGDGDILTLRSSFLTLTSSSNTTAAATADASGTSS